jgi:acyl carrier protein
VVDELERELKKLIVEALKLEDIAPEEIDSEESLFGTGLGLDSIDALEQESRRDSRHSLRAR